MVAHTARVSVAMGIVVIVARPTRAAASTGVARVSALDMKVAHINTVLLVDTVALTLTTVTTFVVATATTIVAFHGVIAHILPGMLRAIGRVEEISTM